MSLRAAILGFLSLKPTSGYLLRKRFEDSVASFWSVTQSQIYRELHTLERDQLVVSEREPGNGKPDRRIYSLSKRGKTELDAWLRAPVEPVHLRHPLLLKLVLATDVEPRAFDEVLAEYEGSLAAKRAEYTARLSMTQISSLARSKREATLWRLSIEHGIAWAEAELAWAKKARRKLRPSRGAR